MWDYSSSQRASERRGLAVRLRHSFWVGRTIPAHLTPDTVPHYTHIIPYSSLLQSDGEASPLSSASFNLISGNASGGVLCFVQNTENKSCYLLPPFVRNMVIFLHTGCKGPTPQIINSHGSSNGSYGGGSNVQQVVVVCRGSEVGLG